MKGYIPAGCPVCGTTTQNSEIMECVQAELKRARTKFPTNEDLLLSFSEEAGEVVKAFLDFKQGKTIPKNVFKELIQAISMAIRLIEEGDAGFDYKTKPSYLEAMK